MREYFKVPPFVVIVFRKDNHVLLLKRTNTNYFDGHYALPAGAIEPEESVVQAATREAREEVGVTLYPQALRFLHVLYRKSDTGFQNVVFFIEATLWSGELKNCEPDKHEEMTWFAQNRLPGDIIPHHRKVLHALNKNTFLSEDGWDDPKIDIEIALRPKIEKQLPIVEKTD